MSAMKLSIARRGVWRDRNMASRRELKARGEGEKPAFLVRERTERA